MAVLDELIRSIARVTRCSERDITAETRLADIKADSLHWLQIIVGVENALGIEVDIDKERMSQLGTVGDFARYIERFIK
jgi:acyl carrier protein